MNVKQKLSCGFWNIGIIEIPIDKFINIDYKPEIKWMRHNSKSKFYADPFPESEDEKHYYILAEEYSYFTGKGVIVRLSIDKSTMKLVYKENIIESSYHLSFPFIYDGAIIPEQYKSGMLISYKNGKESVICDYPVIDPVLLDYNDKKFLFGTLPCADNKGHNRSLFWFEWNGKKYIPKFEMPIKEDVKSSRFAGAFFYIGDSLYRPAQDCEQMYGGQTRIMRVSIENNNYIEEEVKVINSRSSNKFNEGLHTFNPWRNIIVVDGYQNEYRLLLKPIFVLCRFIRKIIK